MLIVLGALVCFVPLALTGSRTAILGASLAIAFEVLLVLLQMLNGRINTALRVSVSLLIAAVTFFAFNIGSEIVVQLNNSILARQETVAVITQVVPKAEMLPQEPEALAEPIANNIVVVETNREVAALAGSVNETGLFTRDSSNTATFNGRTELWLGVWNGIMENPKILLMGTGPMKASEVMAPYFPPNSPIGIFHNSLVGVLVAHGLLALVLALTFLVLVAFASIRLSFGKKSHEPLSVRLLPAILLFTVAEGMMEDFLFTSITFFIAWVWFMIAAGFVLRFGKQEPERSKPERS